MPPRAFEGTSRKVAVRHGATKPTVAQVNATRAVVRWYLQRYHKTRDDPGVLEMFHDRAKVGAFAVTRDELRSGDRDALFRLLVATTMFQRRQDVQILRVLRGIAPARVLELTSPRRLLKLVDQSPCAHVRSLNALHGACDLTKDAATRAGACGANPTVPCHLKHHTVLLKRYGHFGKVPTSAALMLREAGTTSLRELRDAIFRMDSSLEGRAQLLEEHLSKSWRVSSKIAAMFLSALAAPDLARRPPPWKAEFDWTRFVVIDSNVDLFLASLRYSGSSSYDARREFIRELAKRIELDALSPNLERFNPRLVQQAMYIFMSASNRRGNSRDCMHQGPAACQRCPKPVATRCPVRRR